MNQVIPTWGENLLELGKRCDAVYVCPKIDGKRVGPLVVYAGKDDSGRNLVGDIYFNFRQIERHPQAVEAYAIEACKKLSAQGLLETFDTIVGIPNGGRTFGQMLAFIACKNFAYAVKEPRPTEAGKKQEYFWDLSQFNLEKGERVAIAEDVYNNFQNTDTTLEEIAAFGVEVALLVGALNRSPVHETSYTPKRGPFAEMTLPVVASIREAYPEYTQDDPAVADDIAAGKIEFNVKKNWARLCATMNKV